MTAILSVSNIVPVTFDAAINDPTFMEL